MHNLRYNEGKGTGPRNTDMQATATRRLAASPRSPCLRAAGRRQQLLPPSPSLLLHTAPPRRLRLDRRRSAWPPAATAVPAPHGIPGASAAAAKPAKRRLAALLAPLSDPAANAKLLALCTGERAADGTQIPFAAPDGPLPMLQVYAGLAPIPCRPVTASPPCATRPSAAQMLGSVATLMHESYLAVYLTDVLHMSHTQVRLF